MLKKILNGESIGFSGTGDLPNVQQLHNEHVNVGRSSQTFLTGSIYCMLGKDVLGKQTSSRMVFSTQFL